MPIPMLLKSGISLVKEVFSLVKEGKKILSEDSKDNSEKFFENNFNHHTDEIINSLDKISNEIKNARNDVIYKIIDKIESDKLEDLHSRINAIQIALELEQKDSISALHMELKVLTDYAKQRISEGKEHWVGPWVIGEATRILVLKMSNARRSAEILDREMNKFRIDLLDLHKDQLLDINTPWEAIADFVKGENEEILNNLIISDVDDTEENENKKTVSNKRKSNNKKTNLDVTTSPEVAPTRLAPPAAWPFAAGGKK